MKGIPADSEKGSALAAEVSGGDEQYFVADGRSPGTSWWKHAKEREALERERDFWRDLWQRTALNAIRAEREQWERDALDTVGAFLRNRCRHDNAADDCAYCRECEGAK